MAYPVSLLVRAAQAVCITAVLLLPLALSPAAPAGPQATVAKFHGDYPGAFSFTFDDAMPTQLIYAGPYLDQVGLKGTFFLITDIIADGEAGSPAIGKPTVWADWKALADRGHEIGSHTLSHPDLTTLPLEAAERQVTESSIRLKEKLRITPVTFAYPFHARNAAIDEVALQTCIAVREAQVGYGDKPGMANTAQAMNRYADASVNQKALRVAMIHGLTEPYASLVVEPGRFLVQAVPGPGAITVTWAVTSTVTRTSVAASGNPIKKRLPPGPLFSNSF